MKNSYDIIKSIIRTEKNDILGLPLNKYTFWVDIKANKIEIKKAIEDIYKVKVKSVNTMITQGKLRRVRYIAGYSPNLKKAIITLREGQKISEDITYGA